MKGFFQVGFGTRLQQQQAAFNKMFSNVRRLAKVKPSERMKNNAPFNTRWSFVEKLKTKGFKRLGSGAYGYVVGKEGQSRVLKIIFRPANDPWLSYVHWASKEGFAGTFAPKIYSYKLIKAKDGQNFGVASMERLDKTISELEGTHPFAFTGMLSHYAIANSNLHAEGLMECMVPGFSNFAQKFKEAFKSGYDFHGGNFMVRKDGGFVVTDPVCGDSIYPEIYTTRLKERDFGPVSTCVYH